MVIESVSQVFQSAVHGQVDVVAALDSNEAAELRQALNTIDKYERAVLKAIRKTKQHGDPTESDWRMVKYAIKGNRVTISVKDGMCG